MKPRILILNSGLHHEKAFKWLAQPKMLYVGNLKKTSLHNYHIVIIPFHTDQIVLYRCKRNLEKFLEWGGILIILGATQEGGRDWIPHCQWEQPFTTKMEINTKTDDGAIIFKNISEVEELKYHGIYYAHGALLPTVAENGINILARGEQNRIVMFVRRYGFRGTLFCTTLDPDFHAVAEVPGPNGVSSTVTHQRASHLIQNIIQWAIQESQKKSLWLRFGRRVFGLLSNVVYGFLFWIMLLLPVALLLYWVLLQEEKYKLPNVIVALAVSALFGSIASIWGLWQSWKSERIT